VTPLIADNDVRDPNRIQQYIKMWSVYQGDRARVTNNNYFLPRSLYLWRLRSGSLSITCYLIIRRAERVLWHHHLRMQFLAIRSTPFFSLSAYAIGELVSRGRKKRKKKKKPTIARARCLITAASWCLAHPSRCMTRNHRRAECALE